MKRSYVMVLVLLSFMVVGYATISTAIEMTGKANLAYNEDDFRVEITNLKINDVDSLIQISEDKKSFTFSGTGNEIIEYTVTNFSYQYDTNISLTCIPDDNILVNQIGNLEAQNKETRELTNTSLNEVTCMINIEKISRT